MEVFRKGQLTAALVHFTEASVLMPLRSPVHILWPLFVSHPCIKPSGVTFCSFW